MKPTFRIARLLAWARKRRQGYLAYHLEDKLIKLVGLYRNLGHWDTFERTADGWKPYSRHEALEESEKHLKKNLQRAETRRKSKQLALQNA